MEKNTIYAVLILLIVAFALVAIVGVPQNPFVVQAEGVVFQGENAQPIELLAGLSQEQEFIVSAQVHGPLQQSDSLMFNGSALFIVVLTGNQKNITQLLRIMDSSGSLNHCLTNYGDVKTEETLTAEQCNAMLNDSGKVAILIDFPNTALQKPLVRVSDKRIVVESNSLDAVNNTSFTVLKAMFSNAAEVLAKSNQLASQIGG